MKKYSRIFYTILLSWLMFAANSGAVYAKQEEETQPEWVLSYALVGFCVGVALIFVVRSSKRADSIISEWERKQMQEDELKKAGKH